VVAGNADEVMVAPMVGSCYNLRMLTYLLGDLLSILPSCSALTSVSPSLLQNARKS
jgi:hypothetical protein